MGVGVGLLAVFVGFPFAVGAVAARLVATKLEARLHTPVRIAHARAGLLGITFHDLEIGERGGPAPGSGPAGIAAGPLVHLIKLRVPYGAAIFRRGVIEVDGATVNVRRGGPADNITAVLRAVRPPKTETPVQARAPAGKLPGVAVRNARLTLYDSGSGLSVEVGRLAALFLPGERLDVQVEKVDGVLALGSTGKGPRFGAETITIAGPLDGVRPRGYPTLAVTG
ncbi:MAG: hypothetical protein ABJA82_07605, partial [Myxococcales bacterium]